MKPKILNPFNLYKNTILSGIQNLAFISGRVYKSGYSLIEVTIALLVFSIVMSIALAIFPPAITSTSRAEEYSKLNFLLKEKLELIRGTGFWLWDVDTTTPKYTGNPYDPAVSWANDLANIGYTRKAEINVTFLKQSGSELLDFSGVEFDGTSPRNRVKVNITLYDLNNNALSRSTMLTLYPSAQKVQSVMYLMKLALLQYNHENGSYPLTGNLGLLVDNGFLAEIPNDPYTGSKLKTTHKEELSDWYYDNTGGTITLSPISHRLATDYTLTWN